MVTIIIGIAIALYVFYVIKKRITDIKKGNFCGCGCSKCYNSCNKKTQEEQEVQINE